MKNKSTLIKIGDLEYYSANDEAAFFEWLDKLPFIQKYYGKGDTLYLEIDRQLSSVQMRELISLFARYNKDMKLLLPLVKPAFKKWIQAPTAYWYSLMFQ